MIVTEKTLPKLIHSEDRDAIHSAYNALDCCVTREVHDVLEPRLDENTRRIYQFEHACQQPAIAMSLRGVLIDPARRAEAIAHHEAAAEKADAEVNRLGADVWDRVELRIGRCGDHRNHLWPRGLADDDPAKRCKRCGVNRLQPSAICVGSSQQIGHLFYDLLGVHKRYDRKTGNVTVNAEALESIENEHRRRATTGTPRPHLAEHYNLIARLARLCQTYKKEEKQVGYARSKLGPLGRMYNSTNVGAAETGRWSASKAPDWSGWNIQQISDKLRSMVVADPGLEIFSADMQAAESWIVAYDAGSEAYIEAHKTGDPHTTVAKMIYPDLLPWTGDLATDKELAQKFYFSWDPDHPLRDQMKRVQHGGNMGRSPQGIARQLHIPLKEAERFFALMYGGDFRHRGQQWYTNAGHEAGEDDKVERYPGAFPEIKARHRQIHAELQRTGITISCLGRKRQFLGRVWDDETLREALGQLEQSPVADILNLALLLIWCELDTRLNVWDAPHPDQPNKVWLLAQVHDAIVGLYRPGDVETLRRVKELMEIPVAINGRILTIPVEIQVGNPWSKSGLRKVEL